MQTGDGQLERTPKQCSERQRQGALAWVALALGAFWCAAAQGAPAVTVWVAGSQVTAGPAATLVGGVVWGSPGACAESAGARADWDASGGRLTLSRPDLGRLALVAGSAEAKLGSRAVPLEGKVEVRGGQAYCPLGPVLGALGLRVKWQADARRLTASGVVRSVTVRAGETGARVSVVCTIPCRGLVDGAGDPTKRYVDLAGCQPDSRVPDTRYVYTGPLVRVRTGQPRGKATTRVVADLREPLAARWEPADNGLGGDLVIGRGDGAMSPVARHLPRLNGITTVQRNPGEERLRITSDWPLQPRWSLATKPARIVMDLPEVEAGLAETQLPMAGEFVDSVTVSAGEEPLTVRLSVALRELIRFSVDKTPLGAEVVFRRARLQDQTVALDPGHGDPDTGATGKVLKEKDVNLDVALRTARRLQEAGARYVLTRPTDRLVGLYDRPALALAQHADVFVSIHCNAMPRRNQGHGTETWYYRPDSACLATILQDSLVRNLGRVDRGVKTARFVVVREAKMPAVLAELMFLNDDQEEALLQQDNTRESAAAAIVAGVRGFFEGTGPVAGRG
jgi:N-acetylmuramoyl-L-alanine amidase